ncbi:MAG: DUF5615 family PIN-like protein [Chitinophagales bacterium]|nr:DUF5615 family PIN-like protein [Chitinophagales bacterium]
MKFIVDAQLPRRLSEFLIRKGCDSVHTLDLPNGNRTPDSEVIKIAETEQRIVISKDEDFLNTHLLKKSPPRLLIERTGNIENNQLLSLFERNWVKLIDFLQKNALIEITVAEIIVHE